jgi:hypothetical protein
MSTSGPSYKPTRVHTHTHTHTHTTRRPTHKSLLTQNNKDRKQYNSSFKVWYVHFSPTAQAPTSSQLLPKSTSVVELLEHHQNRSLVLADCRSQRKRKITTSLHFSHNPYSTLPCSSLHHLLAYLAYTTWLPPQAISLAPTHPHECSAASKNHETPSSRQPFSMQPVQTLAIRIRNWSWSAATHERDG